MTRSHETDIDDGYFLGGAAVEAVAWRGDGGGAHDSGHVAEGRATETSTTR